jgi:hypothetical protein
MAEPWPWLAIAGLGALHGLSPANGWMLAAACGVHARDEAHARRALRPIALGQVASMSVLAFAVSQGMSVDRALMRDVACVLLVVAALWLGLRGARPATRIGRPARHAGIALCSFLVASAQGAGLMLVPALAPLCAGGTPARELPGQSPWVVALAAVGVHTVAMFLTTGVVATGACRAVGALTARSAHRRAPSRAQAGVEKSIELRRSAAAAPPAAPSPPSPRAC